MPPKSAAKDRPESAARQSSTSSTLLVAVRAQDPEAWRKLTTVFGPLVHDWCRRAGLQEDDAADVGQEVFRAVAAGIGRFRRDSASDTFRGWLWRITQHKVRDFWRSRARQPDAAGGTQAQQRLAEVADMLAEESSVSEPDATGVFQRSLETIRANFEDRTWHAFWKLTIDQRSAADVAAELGMTTGAVYVAKSRVLSRFREEWSELVK